MEEKNRRRTELIREEKAKEIPHFKTREREVVETRLSKQTLALIILAVLVVLSIVCGIKVFEISAPIICVIVFIELLMGFLISNSPSFVTILLVVFMIFVGIFTKMLDAILIGAVVFTCTVLLLKERN